MVCQIKWGRPSEAVTATQPYVPPNHNVNVARSGGRQKSFPAISICLIAGLNLTIQMCTEDRRDQDLFRPAKASARLAFHNAPNLKQPITASTIDLPALSGAATKKALSVIDRKDAPFSAGRTII